MNQQIRSLESPSDEIVRTSSLQLSFSDKIREFADLSAHAIARAVRGRTAEQVIATLEDYAHYAESLLGKRLDETRIVEIGFGARPWRVAALRVLGADIWGIDVDRPVLHGGPAELAEILKTHGAERALKSALRFHLLDRLERRSIGRKLGRSLRTSEFRDRLIVDDASRPRAWAGLANGPAVDLVVSEDVFEHLPANRIGPLLSLMAGHMVDNGIALIRPFVFTGIAGGHLAEWFAEGVNRSRPRRAAPWEHLRADRFKPNTYLNRLRLDDYRRLFSVEFDILEEVPLQVGLGADYMTPAIRAELHDYSDEELFANNVLFLLRKRPLGGALH